MIRATSISSRATRFRSVVGRVPMTLSNLSFMHAHHGATGGTLAVQVNNSNKSNNWPAWILAATLLAGCSRPTSAPAPRYDFLLGADGAVLWRCDRQSGEVDYVTPGASWRHVTTFVPPEPQTLAKP